MTYYDNSYVRAAQVLLDSLEIIEDAIEIFRPVAALLMFSGGHDSLVASHIAGQLLIGKKVPFSAFHCNTTIGIWDTRYYVMRTCQEFGWDLHVGLPPKEDYYSEIVRKHGFPGSAIGQHQLMYRRLKERSLRRYVTHWVKSSPQARENVLLISGVRKSESLVRMGYNDPITKDDSRIWCSPCFHWEMDDQEAYMRKEQLPRNRVKDLLCHSYDCGCGVYATKEQWAEIQKAYPDFAAEIDELHQVAIDNGHPWPWYSDSPAKWKRKNPPGQMNLFPGIMCANCEHRKNI